MPPSLPAPTLSDQSGLWACGQREDALPTGPTGATTGDYMIEKCQPCNRSTLSAMYPVEPQIDLSPQAGRGGASGARVATSKQQAICDSPAACGARWSKWWRRHSFSLAFATTSDQRLASSASSRPNGSPGVAVVSKPSATSLSFTSGSPAIASAAAWKRPATGFGVLAGMKKPVHTLMTNPG